MISLYLTFFILIVLDSKFGLYNYSNPVKWIFPFCYIKYRSNSDFSDLEFLCDILIHSIFIASYLWSIDIIKVIIQ